MKIGLTGASGFLGTALAPAAEAVGHEVVRFVRRTPSAGERQWDATTMRPDDVGDLDAVIHLSGAGVGDKRWSTSYKRAVLESRTVSTRAVADAVSRAGVPVLLSASGIGYYGDSGDAVLDETGPAGSTFLADVCVQWEAAAQSSARTVLLRTGIVQSRRGGALKKQLPIFRAAAGAPLGDGTQWVSWITLHDHVQAVLHLLTADVEGPANLVTPHPVTNAEYTKALGKAVHRPTLPIGVPGLVLRAGLGEFAGELLGGQRLVPAALEKSGFTWRDPELPSALERALADD